MENVANTTGRPANATSGVDVQPWDPREAGRIRDDELREVKTIHDGFARSLSGALGGYFRVPFETALASADYLPYEAFLQRLSQGSYVGCCRISPIGGTALVELDRSLTFPVLDLLLGGKGTAEMAPRETTDIEEEVLAGIMRVICAQLQSAWHELAVQFVFDHRQAIAEAHRILDRKQRMLCLGFEVQMLENRGRLNIAVPASASHSLLRKMASPRQAGPCSPPDLRTKLLMCPFTLELVIEGLRIPVHELLNLTPGQVFGFDRAVDSSASVLVGGTPLFSAAPARKGNVRAALLIAVATNQPRKEG